MTKRDFEMIAAVLKRTRPDAPADDPRVRHHQNVVAQFTTALAAENPRFKATRFLSACGEVV